MGRYSPDQAEFAYNSVHKLFGKKLFEFFYLQIVEPYQSMNPQFLISDFLFQNWQMHLIEVQNKKMIKIIRKKLYYKSVYDGVVVVS